MIQIFWLDLDYTGKSGPLYFSIKFGIFLQGESLWKLKTQNLENF